MLLKENMKNIDAFLPQYDFSERHEMAINASPEKVYEAFQHIEFSQSFIIRTLMRVRGYKGIKFQKKFVILSEEPPKEIVLGLIGRPWLLKGTLLPTTKENFQVFQEPGYAKMVWNFAFEPVGNKTIASTETRIWCTDKTSRFKFGVYWFFIRPFSGLVRWEMLRTLRKSVEHP